MATETKSAFGKNLMTIRKERGIKRRALAKMLGIHEVLLQNYELSGQEPKFELLVKIADFFGVSVDQLVRPKDFIKIPFSVTSDGQNISIGDSLAYISNLSKSNTINLIQCLQKELNSNIDSFRDFADNNIFTPKDSTEINLSCQNSKTKLNLNLKIENLKTEDAED